MPRYPIPTFLRPGARIVIPPTCRPRPFSTTTSRWTRQQQQQQQQQKERFRSRLGSALNNTKIQWYPIPVGLGIGCVGLLHFYKTQRQRHEQEKRQLEDEDADSIDVEPGAARLQRRPRVRPDGPWQVQVMSTLPLKAISRLWGRFNELNIPYYLRVPGFKLYAFIFGVNLDEVAEPDLHVYPNLAAFFYRTLKSGARPLDPSPYALLSPADGRVLQFGRIEGNDIEQVKGMTYTIDALLGDMKPNADDSTTSDDSSSDHPHHGDEELVKNDEEFAQVNGISYTLPNLLSGSGPTKNSKSKPKSDPTPQKAEIQDQSAAPSSPSTVSAVRADLALGSSPPRPWYSLLNSEQKHALYYAVVYLAPGDYHRFHAPCNWVVERRRHFAGELYSVSPYLQRTLPGLFTLNERVVLLGRWRWGFFAFVPVGATNVGSIKVNFDNELRTNSLTTDTEADRRAEEAASRGETYDGFVEAGYEGASRVLGGVAVRRGEEMGGFKLGSTVVLVFEAPVEEGGEVGGEGKGNGGFRWKIEKGQKVRMGQALGYVEE